MDGEVWGFVAAGGAPSALAIINMIMNRATKGEVKDQCEGVHKRITELSGHFRQRLLSIEENTKGIESARTESWRDQRVFCEKRGHDCRQERNRIHDRITSECRGCEEQA